MKFFSSSEWFELERPLAEPEVDWKYSYPYMLERVVKQTGEIIWFGCAVNFKKEKDGKWGVLTTNYDAKPLEKYLPEIVYGEDRNYFKECEEPVYETLYKQLH